MKISIESITNCEQWEKSGVKLPRFNVCKMKETTKRAPKWLHFGSGNIFRGFLASLQQQLLDEGKTDTGIIAVESYDYEIIEKIYKPYDELSLLVTLDINGKMDKRLIACIADSIAADSAKNSEWTKLLKLASAPTLQIISFTITEKGYNLISPDGDYLSEIKNDIENGPQMPAAVIPKVTALLYARYKAGAYPISLVSMDNCSHNGEKLRTAVLKIAEEWQNRSFVDNGFVKYVGNNKIVAFPSTMIDKITPRPSPDVQKQLESAGFEDVDIIHTAKGTFIAPFVNAEAPQYLVVEDNFPNGRPPLEDAGVIFTDRATVEKAERMKLCTCLNPLHTALAVFGCLLGYDLIADEMKNPLLVALVKGVGLKEGLPVVADPKILDPQKFINEVIEDRLPNPYIPDSPQRIACDTSQKIPNRFGNTLKLYSERADLDTSTLIFIPLVIAGWCRYLMGLDDNLEKMPVSPDPILEELQSYINGVKIGQPETIHDALQPILQNKDIFKVNLYDAAIGEKIESYFAKMIAGRGAVAKTLKEVTEQNYINRGYAV